MSCANISPFGGQQLSTTPTIKYWTQDLGAHLFPASAGDHHTTSERSLPHSSEEPTGKPGLSVPPLPPKRQRNLFPGHWSRCSHQNKTRLEQLLLSSPLHSLVTRGWHGSEHTAGPWLSKRLVLSSNYCFAMWKIIKVLGLLRALEGTERG